MKINRKKAMLIGLASSVLFAGVACSRNKSEEGTTTQATTKKPNITVEDNELEDVYGPPVEDNEPDTVYGPPEDLLGTDTDALDNVEVNIHSTVYGPPTTTEEN